MRRITSLLCSAALASLASFTALSAHAQTAPADVQPPGGTVLVLPFASASGGNDWMGKAVQQDLLTDLTQGTTTRVLAPSSAAAAHDSEAALLTARNSGASIVVFGQAQSAGKEVRLTGQVLDVATARPLGALKATGPSDELFHLEDALAGQVFLALPRTLLTAQTLRGVQQAAEQQATNATQPPPSQVGREVPVSVYSPPSDSGVSYSPQQYYSYATPTYSYEYPAQVYNYYYPDYTYGYPSWGIWPFWGGSIFITGNFGFHHHHGDGHWDGHNGWNGGGNRDGGNGFHSTGQSQFARGGTSFSRSSESFAGIRSAGSGLQRSTFQPTGAPRMSSGTFHGGISSGGFQSAPRSGGFAAGGGFHGGGFSSGGGFHGGGFSAGVGHAAGGSAGGGGHR